MKRVTIEFTMQEAESLGLLVCSSCGYPKSNHFSFGKKKCAHSGKCRGYKAKVRVGKLLETIK